MSGPVLYVRLEQGQVYIAVAGLDVELCNQGTLLVGLRLPDLGLGGSQESQYRLN